jgi:hypothetical protein
LGNGGGVAISVIGGTGLFADGTAAAPSISFAADSDTGFYRVAANIIGVANNGSISLAFVAGGKIQGSGLDNELTLAGNGSVSLRAGGADQNITLTPSGTGYTILSGNVGIGTSTPTQGQLQISGNSDAGSGANRPRIALTNLAGAGVQWTIQSWSTSGDGNLRFYRSSGASGNYIFSDGRMLLGTLTDSGALLQIGNDSSVISGGMVFGTNTFFYRRGDGILGIGHATLPQLYFTDPSGNVFGFVLGTTNLLRLGGNGASGQTRIDSGGAQACIFDTSQNATFAGAISGTNITASTGAYYAWTAKSRIKSPSDGVVTLLNAAETDFTRLQFGGTTASFPAIKRTGAQFDLLLADESDFTTVRLANVRAVRAAATASAGEVAYGGTTATTVGAAGGASLLPATPLGYIIVNVAGTAAKIPYYNS